jgi:hypothetical protein
MHVENILGLKNPYDYFSDKVIISNFSDGMWNQLTESLNNLFPTIKNQADVVNYLLKDYVHFLPDNFLFKCNDVERRKYFSEEEYQRSILNSPILYYDNRVLTGSNYFVRCIFYQYLRGTPFHEKALFDIYTTVTRNEMYERNQTDQRLSYVLNHMLYFKVTKLRYKFRKLLCRGKKRQKYADKFRSIKNLLKEAKEYKKQMFTRM